MSYVSCLTTPVSCLLFLVYFLFSPVLLLLSSVSHLLSHGLLTQVSCPVQSCGAGAGTFWSEPEPVWRCEGKNVCFTTFEPIFIWKGAGAREIKVPEAGAGQKRTGSATLLLSHVPSSVLLSPQNSVFLCFKSKYFNCTISDILFRFNAKFDSFLYTYKVIFSLRMCIIVWY